MRITTTVCTALLISTAAFASFLVPPALVEWTWFSTDQWDFIAAAETLKERHTVVTPSPMNARFNTVIFGAHQYPYVSMHEGQIVQYPPGYPLLIAALTLLVPNYHVASCLLAAFGVFLFYLWLHRCFGTRPAVFGTITLACTPIFAFYAPAALADIPSFVLLLAAMLVYDQMMRVPSVIGWGALGLLLGASVWLKYANVVFLVAIVVHYCVHHRHAPARGPCLAAFFTVTCLLLLGLLGYHHWAFGNPLQTGYSYFELLPPRPTPSLSTDTGAIGAIVDSLMARPWKQAAVRATNLPVLFSICAPVATASLVAAAHMTDPKHRRPLSLTLYLSAATMAFYLLMTGNTYGTSEYDRLTFSSFNRYLLPTYCLLLVPVAVCAGKLRGLAYASTLVVAVALSLSSSWLSTLNLSNLHWHIDHQRKTLALRNLHEQLVPEGAVLVGCSVDFYLVHRGRHTIECRPGNAAWESEVNRVLSAALDSGYPVYVLEPVPPSIHLNGYEVVTVDAEAGVSRVFPREGGF